MVRVEVRTVVPLDVVLAVRAGYGYVYRHVYNFSDGVHHIWDLGFGIQDLSSSQEIFMEALEFGVN